jgi:hypothetical protein
MATINEYVENNGRFLKEDSSSVNVADMIETLYNNQKPSTSISSTDLVSVDTTSGGTVIVSANSSRRKIIIQNQGLVPVLLNFGDSVSVTSYRLILSPGSGVRVGDGASWESESYKGEIKGLTESSSANISVLEEEI